MKKFFTLLAATAVSLSAMATTFTFSSDADLTQTKDGITVTLAKGSGNNVPTAANKSEMRLYASNTITVTGASLSNISMTFSKQGSKDYATMSASTGNLVSGGVSTSNDNKVLDQWSGNASSVTFTIGDKGQRIIYQMIVNGDGTEDPGLGGGDDEPGTTPGGSTELDPDYVYAEPTVIGKANTTAQGAPYSFVENNILVSTPQGAANENYFSVYAGFDMTFTATKPIKGIVINGYVKKGFEASVNHGTVDYLSPDGDTEANPVVVITDINSTSVTISCEKQLRCYEVLVYFDANPDATVEGGTTGGPTGGNNLVFDSCEVVHEIEYGEQIGEENYSVFLYNDADYDVYFALDLYPTLGEDIVGTYSWDDYSLGDYCYYVYGWNDDDMTWVDGGTVNVSKNGSEYTITGTLICDNGKTYTISYTGKPYFYTDDEYYGDGDDDDDDSAVKDIDNDEDKEAPMYDVTGRRVSKDYRGIYIRNGRKYVGF